MVGSDAAAASAAATVAVDSTEALRAAEVSTVGMEVEDSVVAADGLAEATAEDTTVVGVMAMVATAAVATADGEIAAGAVDAVTGTGMIGPSASVWDIGPGTTGPIGDSDITLRTDIPTTRTIRITILTIRTIRPTTHLTGATRTAPTIATLPDTARRMIRLTRPRLKLIPRRILEAMILRQ